MKSLNILFAGKGYVPRFKFVKIPRSIGSTKYTYVIHIFSYRLEIELVDASY